MSDIFSHDVDPPFHLQHMNLQLLLAKSTILHFECPSAYPSLSLLGPSVYLKDIQVVSTHSCQCQTKHTLFVIWHWHQWNNLASGKLMSYRYIFHLIVCIAPNQVTIAVMLASYHSFHWDFQQYLGDTVSNYTNFTMQAHRTSWFQLYLQTYMSWEPCHQGNAQQCWYVTVLEKAVYFPWQGLRFKMNWLISKNLCPLSEGRPAVVIFLCRDLESES